MSERAVAVHGHFYQPPRENPWTDEIERQPSAAPFHDWNVRITEQCYRPNAAARIHDDAGRLRATFDNYAHMSFDFGPTLLSWLERAALDVYRAIVAADGASASRFGRGSAMAQVYNHLIAPLANERDLRCQVAWGVRDFEHRFGRRPEGMWLPETAVDLRTLEALAAEGLRFTLLAPHQARRTRAPGEDWRPSEESRLDTTLPYRQALPSGRSIAIFFFDGPLSRELAFEGLARDGQHFARRLVARLPQRADEPRVAHVATDGETYGHHQVFAEMGLAAALERLSRAQDVRLTNYASFLARHAPRHEVEIAEQTSWSCPHGLERWRSDCGCAPGEGGGAWRAVLREAFDWLRDALAPLYEARAARLVREPWAARERYVDVLLDPREEGWRLFLAHETSRALGEDERRELRGLLELQRFALLMYTSCGWFFEDLGRIEPLQLLRYAGRAVELARELGLGDLGPELEQHLDGARSGRPGTPSGAELFRRHVVQREPTDTPG